MGSDPWRGWIAILIKILKFRQVNMVAFIYVGSKARLSRFYPAVSLTSCD